MQKTVKKVHHFDTDIKKCDSDLGNLKDFLNLNH